MAKIDCVLVVAIRIVNQSMGMPGLTAGVLVLIFGGDLDRAIALFKPI